MAADKGQISAMYNYGLLLAKGVGVSKNKEEACRYLKMAANKGDIDVMTNYDRMLEEDDDEEMNEEEDLDEKMNE